MNIDDEMNISNPLNISIESLDYELASEDNDPAYLMEKIEYEELVENHIINLIANLPSRELDIILSRKYKDVPLSARDLSEKYRISTSRVRQIEEKTFCQLKQIADKLVIYYDNCLHN